ncbi:hypothetical protein ACWDLG_10675 [Nonomuraea sp. NPDC003727]
MTTRDDLINGLIDLAAFLEANPSLPVPDSVDAYAFPDDDGTDEEMRHFVNRAAIVLETVPSEHSGHYRAVRAFGPAAYRAVAILASARTRPAA